MTNRSRLFSVHALFLVILLTQAGCSDGLEVIDVIVGGSPLEVEVARTTDEQARGLMFRKTMSDDHGMLFPYESDRRLSFWMKDTLIPLSIAYISADRIIKEIHDMKPGSMKEVVSGQSVRYALEVNQGLFARLGVEVGDRVEFPGGDPR